MTPAKARRYLEIASTKFDIDPIKGTVSYKDGRIAGSISGAGYLRVKAAGVDVYAHRLVWYFVHKEVPMSIDHIDGCKTNNNILNLRSITHAENHQNKAPQANCWTGVPGVNFDFQRGKWVAKIKTNNLTKFIGRFAHKQDAVEARLAAEKELHPFRRAA